MTRRLPVVLVVLGVLLITAAVIAAVVVRSTDTATLALPQRPDSAAVVVTEPGVLSAVDDTVTVRAVAEDDEPVLLAIGRTAEVEAWLDEADHVRVVGLSSWEELSVEVSTSDGEPTPTAEPTDDATAAPTPTAEPTDAETPSEEPTGEAPGLPDPAGSDLWIVEASGTGEVELSWTDLPGRWSLVAATNGQDPAPMVELEWGREARTPWLVPGIIIGALVLIAGATMLVLDGLARREQRRRDQARSRVPEWTPAGTGPVATVPVSVEDTDPGTGQRLSRRQIREMEKAVARDERRRRREAEEAPPIPLAGEGAADGDIEDPPGEAEAPDISEATPASPQDAEPADDDAPTATPNDGGTVPESASDEPTAAGSTDAEDDEDDDADDEDEDAMVPSWRSVWGFGATPAPPQDTPIDDAREDREEER